LSLVILGGTNDVELDEAVGVFLDSGFQLARWLSPWDGADAVLPLRGDVVQQLKDADAQNIRYVLVHVGSADGRAGGSHDRAHHRVDIAQLRELAQTLRSSRTDVLAKLLALVPLFAMLLITIAQLSGSAMQPAFQASLTIVLCLPAPIAIAVSIERTVRRARGKVRRGSHRGRRAGYCPSRR